MLFHITNRVVDYELDVSIGRYLTITPIALLPVLLLCTNWRVYIYRC